MDKKILNALLKPTSIAIVGASNSIGKIGFTIIEKLLEDNFPGEIYPVNPKDDEVQGLKAYSSILDIEKPIDKAVICVPAKITPAVVEECGQKGVRALSIITSGFGEVGDTETEEALAAIARKYGMGILGPNIIRVLSNSENMNASFAPKLPLKGGASLISQSGALLIALDMATFTRNVGFDKLISIGNMSDINFADLIEWLDEDEATSCITLYIEGLQDGRAFIEKASKATKPIVALKSGKSSHGAVAAASHTGSLAGGAKVYDAAFDQAGVIQATSVSNLFDLTQALSLQPAMEGDNVLILTNGGGMGVLATDSAEDFGMPLKFAPEDFQKEMKNHIPSFRSAKNPVDITGGAGLEWYYKSCKFAYMHKWVDALVVLYCETAVTNPMEIAKGIHNAISESSVTKPIIVSFVGGQRSDDAIMWLVKNGIPAYDSPEKAMQAASALKKYAEFKRRSPVILNSPENIYKVKAMEIINKAKAEGRTDALTEVESKAVFEAYDIKTATTRLAKSKKEAVELANENGYPVVCKIVSSDILHKSDAGGVKVNMKSDADVENAWDEIMVNAKAYKPNAKILGIVIQDMAPWGTQVIVGSVNDPIFGPTVMFGLGGIFVEVLKDVTFRVAPIDIAEATKMLDEINSSPILDGVRGEPRQDKEALADILAKYSKMIVELDDVVAETDANPVFVYDDGNGVCVVDARVILK